MVDFQTAVDTYQDDAGAYHTLHAECVRLVNENQYLKAHRDWVEANNWGYGDREFHWMWKMLVDQMPAEFRFLEIGVFKGQTLSLVPMIAERQNKTCHTFGISPMDTSGDKYSGHPDVDYLAAIRTIFTSFGINSWANTKLIRGYSNDPDVVRMADAAGPYDVVYIDGCHDYEVVCTDINDYKKMIKPGGFMVVDDCNNFLNMPRWPGLEDVSRAVRDCLENDPDFVMQFAVTHNRIWRKVR